MSAMDDLIAFSRRFVDLPPQRQLHCGQVVWDVLRGNLSPTNADVFGLAPEHRLHGVPVHVDPDLPDGAWRLTERDGTVVASGDIAPGHRRAVYVPGIGVVAFPEAP